MHFTDEGVVLGHQVTRLINDEPECVNDPRYFCDMTHSCWS